MIKKTLAEIETNNSFMPLYKAEKIGKQYEWFKRFRKEYRKLTTRKN
jgi:hypothetical protein